MHVIRLDNELDKQICLMFIFLLKIKVLDSKMTVNSINF